MKYLLLGLLMLAGCGTTEYVPVSQPVPYPQPYPIQSNIYKIHCNRYIATYCGFTVYACNNSAVYNCLNQAQALYLLN